MRKSLRLSAPDAVILLAIVISMFVIDAANLGGTVKVIIICIVGAACIYF